MHYVEILFKSEQGLLFFYKKSYYFTNVKALFTTKVSKHFILRGPCYTFHVLTILITINYA